MVNWCTATYLKSTSNHDLSDIYRESTFSNADPPAVLTKNETSSLLSSDHHRKDAVNKVKTSYWIPFAAITLLLNLGMKIFIFYNSTKNIIICLESIYDNMWPPLRRLFLENDSSRTGFLDSYIKDIHNLCRQLEKHCSMKVLVFNPGYTEQKKGGREWRRMLEMWQWGWKVARRSVYALLTYTPASLVYRWPQSSQYGVATDCISSFKHALRDHLWTIFWQYFNFRRKHLKHLGFRWSKSDHHIVLPFVDI